MSTSVQWSWAWAVEGGWVGFDENLAGLALMRTEPWDARSGGVLDLHWVCISVELLGVRVRGYLGLHPSSSIESSLPCITMGARNRFGSPTLMYLFWRLSCIPFGVSHISHWSLSYIPLESLIYPFRGHRSRTRAPHKDHFSRFACPCLESQIPKTFKCSLGKYNILISRYLGKT